MGQENAASDADNTSNNEISVTEIPGESLMKKEEGSTAKVVDEKHTVEEIPRGKTCNDKMDGDSKDKVANIRDQLLEEILDKDVVAQNDGKKALEKEEASIDMAPQEVVEKDQSNKKTLEKHNEPKEVAQKEVFGQERENIDMIENSNKSCEVVPQDVVKQDDESKGTVGEGFETKDFAAPDNQVKAVTEEEKQKKEMLNVIIGNTKVIDEDDQIKKLPRDVNEEETGEDKKVNGSENGGDVDKEKNNAEQEIKGGVSDNEAMDIERNLEEKSVTVENGLKTEEARERGFNNEENNETEGKESKKRKRGKTVVDKAKGEKKDEQDSTTPVNFASSRPVRQRKSVERLVASIEKDIIREIFVEKGSGLALKDIPNVAYKLSKKRNDETFKQLHTILFGRRGKAIQMKDHVSQFSGFVWHDNEEMRKVKVKEKFDKFIKEKLLEFCDVLDIQITNKVTTRKEDIVTKIMEFLAAPHATTDVLLSKKEQSEKSNKRKRAAGQGSPTPGSSKGSRKQRRKTSEKPKEGIKVESDIDGESDNTNEDEVVKGNQEIGNGKQNQSENELSEKSAAVEKLSESTNAMDEDTKHHRRQLKKISTKVDSSAKKRTKPNTPKKSNLNDSEKASGEDAKNQKSPNQSSVKARSTRKTVKKSDTPSKVGGTSKLVPDTDKKAPSSKVTTGKSNHAENVKEKIGFSSEQSIKNKTAKTDPKSKPSDKVLRDQICQILKEVDFNTATFTDILKLLVKHFKTDLTPRKATIKLMIQEELTKMADDEDVDVDVEADVIP